MEELQEKPKKHIDTTNVFASLEIIPVDMSLEELKIKLKDYLNEPDLHSYGELCVRVMYSKMNKAMILFKATRPHEQRHYLPVAAEFIKMIRKETWCKTKLTISEEFFVRRGIPIRTLWDQVMQIKAQPKT